MRYAVINEANEIVNVIVWDGVTPYSPGQGLTLQQVLEGEEELAVIGGNWYGVNRFTPEGG